MSKLPFPRRPSEIATNLAKEILRGRFIADHKDYNRMLAAVREQGLSVEHAFCGECAERAISVVEAIAEENLRTAPRAKLERKLATLCRKVEASVTASLHKFDPNRLGGPGAAGRERDRARQAEGRNLTRMLADRLAQELARRETEAQRSAATFAPV